MNEDTAKASERRDADRSPVSIPARLFLDDNIHQVLATDISFEGMAIVGIKEFDLVRGKKVHVEWGTGMRVESIVLWAKDDTAGLIFTHELADDHPLMTGENH